MSVCACAFPLQKTRTSTHIETVVPLCNLRLHHGCMRPNFTTKWELSFSWTMYAWHHRVVCHKPSAIIAIAVDNDFSVCSIGACWLSTIAVYEDEKEFHSIGRIGVWRLSTNSAYQSEPGDSWRLIDFPKQLGLNSHCQLHVSSRCTAFFNTSNLRFHSTNIRETKMWTKPFTNLLFIESIGLQTRFTNKSLQEAPKCRELTKTSYTKFKWK